MATCRENNTTNNAVARFVIGTPTTRTLAAAGLAVNRPKSNAALRRIIGHYMAVIHPFRALRPRPAAAAAVAAVPYDVVTTEEARALANGNPLSFLRVSRPELELPPGADPHAAGVYDRAVENFRRLRQQAMV